MNVLAIGGHYDDIELGAGGTIAKHICNGDNVTFLVVTESSYNNHDGTPLRSKEQASMEGKTAAKILGVDNVLCLGYQTKCVEYSVDLIEKINGIIDALDIDTVYTHWDGDVHQDHSAIAKATLNAARHIPRVLMYRSNWYQSTKQFNGVFYSDISEYVDKKINSLKAHTTEYNRRGDDWINFVKHQDQNAGIRMGVSYAECFQVVKWLR